LSEDSSPRAIDEEALPIELTNRPDATTTIPPEEGEDRQVYRVSQQDDGTSRLVEVTRRVRADDDDETKIQAVLESLVRRSEAGESSAGTNFIPPGVAIQGVDLNTNSNTVTIDLSADMADVDGPGQPLAYAQLVWTATQFEGVDNVVFTIDGEVSNAVDGRGQSESLVSRASYENFAPLGG
jgi:spore germination protein GerM